VLFYAVKIAFGTSRRASVGAGGTGLLACQSLDCMVHRLRPLIATITTGPSRVWIDGLETPKPRNPGQCDLSCVAKLALSAKLRCSSCEL